MNKTTVLAGEKGNHFDTLYQQISPFPTYLARVSNEWLYTVTSFILSLKTCLKYWLVMPFLQISLFNPIFPMSSLSLLITKLPTGHRLSVLEVLFSEPHELKELGLRSNIYLIDGQINLRSWIMEDWVGTDNCIRITDHLEHWVPYTLLLTHVFDSLK